MFVVFFFFKKLGEVIKIFKLVVWIVGVKLL